MKKHIVTIGSSPDIYESLNNKLSDIGFEASSFDFNSKVDLPEGVHAELFIIDLIYPLSKCHEAIHQLAFLSRDKSVSLFCLCDYNVLKKCESELFSINEIYPIEKVFPKPLKQIDLLDSINQEFHPHSRSLKKVLAIDDSPTQLAITQKILSPYYDVYTATNGKEGLAMSMKTFPDLILLDIHMPDVNGLKICADLKSFHPTSKTPIIIYSASKDTLQVKKALLSGASDYLNVDKPEKDLIKKIDKFLKCNYISLQDKRFS